MVLGVTELPDGERQLLQREPDGEGGYVYKSLIGKSKRRAEEAERRAIRFAVELKVEPDSDSDSDSDSEPGSESSLDDEEGAGGEDEVQGDCEAQHHWQQQSGQQTKTTVYLRNQLSAMRAELKAARRAMRGQLKARRDLERANVQLQAQLKAAQEELALAKGKASAQPQVEGDLNVVCWSEGGLEGQRNRKRMRLI